MVGAERIRERILIFQLLAALAVCFNHFSISMLKGVDAGISASVYANVAIWGISFLFVSSGFLLHLDFRRAHPAFAVTWREKAELVFRRYWRLMLPVAVAVLVDVLVVSFADFGESPHTRTALPFLLTLSQTWVYKYFGQVSLALPIGGANMAWLGANLFFASIVYALTAGVWRRIEMRPAIAVAVVLAALDAIYYFVLSTRADAIATLAATRYGADVGGAYTVWSWLYEYAPYPHIPAFFCGVLLAQMMGNGRACTAGVAAIGVAGFALVLFGSDAMPRFLGLNLLLIIALRHVGLGSRTMPGLDSGWRRLRSGLLQISCYSYEIYVLHLVIYLPFVRSFVPAPGFGTGLMLFGGVVAVTALMLLFCYGIATFLTEPLRQRILAWFGLTWREDRVV